MDPKKFNKSINDLIRIATSGGTDSLSDYIKSTDAYSSFGAFLCELKLTVGFQLVKAADTATAYNKWRKDTGKGIPITTRKIGYMMCHLFPYTLRKGYKHYMLNKDLRRYVEGKEKEETKKETT